MKLDSATRKKIMRACLIFRALEEIGSNEIDILQETNFNKGKVKIKLREVRTLLEREYFKDIGNHDVVDQTELFQLRKEIRKLENMPIDGNFNKKLILPDGKKSVEVQTPVKQELDILKARKREILEDDNRAFEVYHSVVSLVEDMAIKTSELDMDGVLNLGLLLDQFFKGEVKFVENN
jgi:hypothetical protein